MNEVAVEVVQALSFEGKGDEAKTVADELCWGDIEGSNLIIPSSLLFGYIRLFYLANCRDRKSVV